MFSTTTSPIASSMCTYLVGLAVTADNNTVAGFEVVGALEVVAAPLVGLGGAAVGGTAAARDGLDLVDGAHGRGRRRRRALGVVAAAAAAAGSSDGTDSGEEKADDGSDEHFDGCRSEGVVFGE